MRALGVSRRAGVGLALGVVKRRVQVCREAEAAWAVKFARGECEHVSVATERAALFEAELIAREIEALLVEDARDPA